MSRIYPPNSEEYIGYNNSSDNAMGEILEKIDINCDFSEQDQKLLDELNNLICHVDNKYIWRELSEFDLKLRERLKGINCRGICCICNEKDGCYQYSTNQLKERKTNMTGTEYCNSCEKSDVCMFLTEMIKVIDEADDNMQKSSFKDNITIDYRCKFYKSKPQGNIR